MTQPILLIHLLCFRRVCTSEDKSLCNCPSLHPVWSDLSCSKGTDLWRRVPSCYSCWCDGGDVSSWLTQTVPLHLLRPFHHSDGPTQFVSLSHHHLWGGGRCRWGGTPHPDSACPSSGRRWGVWISDVVKEEIGGKGGRKTSKGEGSGRLV